MKTASRHNGKLSFLSKAALALLMLALTGCGGGGGGGGSISNLPTGGGGGFNPPVPSFDLAIEGQVNGQLGGGAGKPGASFDYSFDPTFEGELLFADSTGNGEFDMIDAGFVNYDQSGLSFEEIEDSLLFKFLVAGEVADEVTMTNGAFDADFDLSDFAAGAPIDLQICDPDTEDVLYSARIPVLSFADEYTVVMKIVLRSDNTLLMGFQVCDADGVASVVITYIDNGYDIDGDGSPDQLNYLVSTKEEDDSRVVLFDFNGGMANGIYGEQGPDSVYDTNADGNVDGDDPAFGEDNDGDGVFNETGNMHSDPQDSIDTIDLELLAGDLNEDGTYSLTVGEGQQVIVPTFVDIHYNGPSPITSAINFAFNDTELLDIPNGQTTGFVGVDFGGGQTAAFGPSFEALSDAGFFESKTEFAASTEGSFEYDLIVTAQVFHSDGTVVSDTVTLHVTIDLNLVPVIEDITIPGDGLATPGTQILIEGFGFQNDSAVFFGNEPADVLTASSGQILAVIPADAQPGQNQVRVLTEGFLSDPFDFDVEIINIFLVRLLPVSHFTTDCLVLQFSEEVNAGTLNGNITLTANGNPVNPLNFSVEDNFVRVNLPGNLNNVSHTLTIDTDVESAQGGFFDQVPGGVLNQYQSSFTPSGTDNTGPQITGINIDDEATEVDPTTTIEVTFNEAIDPLTVLNGGFDVTGGNGVTGTFAFFSSISDNIPNSFVFTPDQPLEGLTSYMIELFNSVTDLSGNALQNPQTVGFDTSLLLLQIDPISGPAETEVTLLGSGFDPVATNNMVFFGGALAEVLSAQAVGQNIELTVVVPNDAVTGDVTVETGGSTSNGIPFTVTLPNITTFDVTVENGPSSIALSSDGTFAYVTNSESSTISRVSIEDGQMTLETTFPAPSVPSEVIMDPLGGNAVALHFGATTEPGESAFIINTGTNEIEDTVTVGLRPVRMAFSADGLRLYVTNFLSGTVSVVDLATNSVTGSFRTENGPNGIALSPFGDIALVCNFFADTVSVYDAASFTPIDSIPTGNGPARVEFSPDGLLWAVTNFNDDTVTVGSTETLEVLGTLTTGNEPADLAFDAFGLLYVANRGTDTVRIFDVNDPENMLTVGDVAVADGPSGVTLSPDGSSLFVTSIQGNTVTNIILGFANHTLNSFSQPFGEIGDTVSLFGNGFTDEALVFFGDVQVPADGSVTFVDEGQLDVVIPEGAATGPVTVVQNSLSSNSLNFFVTPNTPYVEEISPADNSIGVPVTSPVGVFFSEPMDINTITGATFTLTPVNPAGPAVVGSFQFFERFPGTDFAFNAVFFPNADLNTDTQYEVVLTTGILDSEGNSLDGNPFVAGAQNTVIVFNTTDTIAPTVDSVLFADDDDNGIDAGDMVVVNLTENALLADNASIDDFALTTTSGPNSFGTGASVQLNSENSTQVQIILGSNAQFTVADDFTGLPSSRFIAGDPTSLELLTGDAITDLEGNALGTFQLDIGGGLVGAPGNPQIISSQYTNLTSSGFTAGIDAGEQIVVYFNKPVMFADLTGNVPVDLSTNALFALPANAGGPGDFGSGATATLNSADWSQVVITLGSGASFTGEGIYNDAASPNAHGIQLGADGDDRIIDIEGNFAQQNTVDLGQDTSPGPQIAEAIFEDTNENGLIDAGDTLFLTLGRKVGGTVVTQPSTVNLGSLDSGDFVMLGSDTLGGAGLAFEANGSPSGMLRIGSTQIEITLGANPVLNPIGLYDQSLAGQNSSSGIDFTPALHLATTIARDSDNAKAVDQAPVGISGLVDFNLVDIGISEDSFPPNGTFVTGAAFDDVDANGVLNFGDTVTVTFNGPVFLSASAAGLPGDVFNLPVLQDRFGAGAEYERDPLNADQVIITLGDLPRMRPQGTFLANTLDPGSSSGIDALSGVTELLDFGGNPVIPNPDGPVDIDAVLGAGPTLTAARYTDNDNNGVDAGDFLDLKFDRSVLIVSPVSPASDFHLPVQIDNLGSGTSVIKFAPDVLRVILGSNPILTVAGVYNNGNLSAGDPSGVDVDAGALNKIVDITGASANQNEVDIESTDIKRPRLIGCIFADLDANGPSVNDILTPLFDEPMLLDDTQSADPEDTFTLSNNGTFGSGAYLRQNPVDPFAIDIILGDSPQDLFVPGVFNPGNINHGAPTGIQVDIVTAQNALAVMDVSGNRADQPNFFIDIVGQQVPGGEPTITLAYAVNNNGNFTTGDFGDLIFANFTQPVTTGPNGATRQAFYMQDGSMGTTGVDQTSFSTNAQVSTTNPATQPRLAYDSGNNVFLSIWNDTTNNVLKGRAIRPDGTAVGAELVIGGPLPLDGYDLASDGQGNFAVLYAIGGLVRGAIVTANNSTGASIAVASAEIASPLNNEEYPAIVFDASLTAALGGPSSKKFMVVWFGNDGADGVFAQRLDMDPTGGLSFDDAFPSTEFVLQYTSDVDEIRLAGDDNNRFFATWFDGLNNLNFGSVFDDDTDGAGSVPSTAQFPGNPTSVADVTFLPGSGGFFNNSFAMAWVNSTGQKINSLRVDMGKLDNNFGGNLVNYIAAGDGFNNLLTAPPATAQFFNPAVSAMPHINGLALVYTRNNNINLHYVFPSPTGNGQLIVSPKISVAGVNINSYPDVAGIFDPDSSNDGTCTVAFQRTSAGPVNNVFSESVNIPGLGLGSDLLGLGFGQIVIFIGTDGGITPGTTTIDINAQMPAGSVTNFNGTDAEDLPAVNTNDNGVVIQGGDVIAPKLVGALLYHDSLLEADCLLLSFDEPVAFASNNPATGFTLSPLGDSFGTGAVMEHFDPYANDVTMFPTSFIRVTLGSDYDIVAPGVQPGNPIATSIKVKIGNPGGIEDLNGTDASTTQIVDIVTNEIVLFSVSGSTPNPQDTGVDVDNNIELYFTSTLNVNTINASTVILRETISQTTVNAMVFAIDTTLVIDPLAPLAGFTDYEVFVDGSVADIFGNSLVVPYTDLFFTTGSGTSLGFNLTLPPSMNSGLPSEGGIVNSGNFDQVGVTLTTPQGTTSGDHFEIWFSSIATGDLLYSDIASSNGTQVFTPDLDLTTISFGGTWPLMDGGYSFFAYWVEADEFVELPFEVNFDPAFEPLSADATNYQFANEVDLTFTDGLFAHGIVQPLVYNQTVLMNNIRNSVQILDNSLIPVPGLTVQVNSISFDIARVTITPTLPDNDYFLRFTPNTGTRPVGDDYLNLVQNGSPFDLPFTVTGGTGILAKFFYPSAVREGQKVTVVGANFESVTEIDINNGEALLNSPNFILQANSGPQGLDVITFLMPPLSGSDTDATLVLSDGVSSMSTLPGLGFLSTGSLANPAFAMKVDDPVRPLQDVEVFGIDPPVPCPGPADFARTGQPVIVAVGQKVDPFMPSHIWQELFVVSSGALVKYDNSTFGMVPRFKGQFGSGVVDALDLSSFTGQTPPGVPLWADLVIHPDSEIETAYLILYNPEASLSEVTVNVIRNIYSGPLMVDPIASADMNAAFDIGGGLFAYGFSGFDISDNGRYLVGVSSNEVDVDNSNERVVSIELDLNGDYVGHTLLNIPNTANPDLEILNLDVFTNNAGTTFAYITGGDNTNGFLYKFNVTTGAFVTAAPFNNPIPGVQTVATALLDDVVVNERNNCYYLADCRNNSVLRFLAGTDAVSGTLALGAHMNCAHNLALNPVDNLLAVSDEEFSTLALVTLNNGNGNLLTVVDKFVCGSWENDLLASADPVPPAPLWIFPHMDNTDFEEVHRPFLLMPCFQGTGQNLIGSFSGGCFDPGYTAQISVIDTNADGLFKDGNSFINHPGLTDSFRILVRDYCSGLPVPNARVFFNDTGTGALIDDFVLTPAIGFAVGEFFQTDENGVLQFDSLSTLNTRLQPGSADITVSAYYRTFATIEQKDRRLHTVIGLKLPAANCSDLLILGLEMVDDRESENFISGLVDSTALPGNIYIEPTAGGSFGFFQPIQDAFPNDPYVVEVECSPRAQLFGVIAMENGIFRDSDRRLAPRMAPGVAWVVLEPGFGINGLNKGPHFTVTNDGSVNTAAHLNVNAPVIAGPNNDIIDRSNGQFTNNLDTNLEVSYLASSENWTALGEPSCRIAMVQSQQGFFSSDIDPDLIPGFYNNASLDFFAYARMTNNKSQASSETYVGPYDQTSALPPVRDVNLLEPAFFTTPLVDGAFELNTSVGPDTFQWTHPLNTTFDPLVDESAPAFATTVSKAVYTLDLEPMGDYPEWSFTLAAGVGAGATLDFNIVEVVLPFDVTSVGYGLVQGRAYRLVIESNGVVGTGLVLGAGAIGIELFHEKDLVSLTDTESRDFEFFTIDSGAQSGLDIENVPGTSGRVNHIMAVFDETTNDPSFDGPYSILMVGGETVFGNPPTNPAEAINAPLGTILIQDITDPTATGEINILENRSYAQWVRGGISGGAENDIYIVGGYNPASSLVSGHERFRVNNNGGSNPGDGFFTNNAAPGSGNISSPRVGHSMTELWFYSATGFQQQFHPHLFLVTGGCDLNGDPVGGTDPTNLNFFMADEFHSGNGGFLSAGVTFTGAAFIPRGWHQATLLAESANGTAGTSIVLITGGWDGSGFVAEPQLLKITYTQNSVNCDITTLNMPSEVLQSPRIHFTATLMGSNGNYAIRPTGPALFTHSDPDNFTANVVIVGGFNDIEGVLSRTEVATISYSGGSLLSASVADGEPLQIARFAHTAHFDSTSGLLVVIGGGTETAYFSTANPFDGTLIHNLPVFEVTGFIEEAAGAFSPFDVNGMLRPRAYHRSILLRDLGNSFSKIIVSGGTDDASGMPFDDSFGDAAQKFDPVPGGGF